MNDEPALLRQFAQEGSEVAFREIVARRIDFVYGAALRQVGGDVHLAQEVAQGVLLDVARKARSLAQRPSITGWLYTSVRFAAAKALRSRARRLNYEAEAYTMQQALASQTGEINWRELRPVIDRALHELGERDREAILLRYFEGRSVPEVAAALGVAENAARMRVERALEKLRVRLARRGVTSTAAALGVALASQPGELAPAGLIDAIAAAWQSGAPLAGTTSNLMNAIKLLTGMAVAGAAGIAAAHWMTQSRWEQRLAVSEAEAGASLAALRADNERLKRDLARAQAEATPAAPDPLADLRALVRATEEKVISGTMAFGSLLRTQNGQLQPGVARVFNLNAEEKAAVENTLQEMRAQLDLLAVTHIETFDQPSPNRIVITFKLFPEEGAKLYDRFVEALKTTLGSERHAALLTLMGESFERVGSGFGARERTVTIIHGGEMAPGMVYGNYMVSDMVTLSHSKLMSSTAGTRATIEREFPGIVKRLPADF